MSDPTTPAAPEEPTPAAAGAAPEVPVTPQPTAAEPAAPAVASDPLHAAQNQAPAANPYVAPAAGHAAPAGGYASAPAAKSPVLSIISLVAGIIGILGAAIAFIPFIGGILQLFIPAAAVILGFLGKSKEPFAPKGLWLTGIILGFVGLGVAVLSLIGWGILFAASGSLS